MHPGIYLLHQKIDLQPRKIYLQPSEIDLQGPEIYLQPLGIYLEDLGIYLLHLGIDSRCMPEHLQAPRRDLTAAGRSNHPDHEPPRAHFHLVRLAQVEPAIQINCLLRQATLRVAEPIAGLRNPAARSRRPESRRLGAAPAGCQHADIKKEYASRMQVATGIVVDGKVVVEGLELPEGETVVVLTREPEGEVHLSPEEEADLLEAIAEADRGETISAEGLFARLDRIR